MDGINAISPDLVVEVWHLIVAISVFLVSVATGAIAFFRLYTSYRGLAKERQADQEAKTQKVSAEALRLQNIERDLEDLKSWKNSHVEACSAEHAEIRDAVKHESEALAAKIEGFEAEAKRDRGEIHNRVDVIEKNQGEIKGSLDTLLKFLIPQHASPLSTS